MKSRRTKALEIPPAVKRAVWARDGEKCVICERWVPMFFANAHFIARSHGGLGIEENIFTACQSCHDTFDKTTERPILREALRRYLKSKYPGWDEQSLYYTKGALYSREH